MPPINAPSPAESMKDTADISTTKRCDDASSASDWRNWQTVDASISPMGWQTVQLSLVGSIRISSTIPPADPAN
jgi:hypothetical protein